MNAYTFGGCRELSLVLQQLAAQDRLLGNLVGGTPLRVQYIRWRSRQGLLELTCDNDIIGIIRVTIASQVVESCCDRKQTTDQQLSSI